MVLGAGFLCGDPGSNPALTTDSSVILVNGQLVCLMLRSFELFVSCICSAPLAFVLNKVPMVNKGLITIIITY